MLAQITVGPQNGADGAVVAQRAGKMGDAIFSELHGRYYEQAYRKNLFFSTSLAQTLSVVGTAMTGHIIYNGNTGMNLSLQKIFLQVSVSSATMTGIGLAYAVQSAAPTGLTVASASGSAILGVTTSQSKAYIAATITSPLTQMILAHNTAAINTVGVDQLVIDLEGSIVVPPNSVICLSALGAASAASGVSSTIMYEEVAI